MKNLTLTLAALMLLVFSSCNNEDDFENVEEKIISTRGLPSLVFSNSEELQNFVGELKQFNEKELSSQKIIELYQMATGNNSLQLTSGVQNSSPVNFVSLLDSLRNVDLAHLTEEDWAVINSDPEEPVYVPIDSLIMDPYFASVLNVEREIQVDNYIYKYTEDGLYRSPSPINGSGSDMPYSWTIVQDNIYADGCGPGTPSSDNNSGIPLMLKNGVTIPGNKIRDINYRDRGDSNAITNAWTSLWGKHKVARNKFSSSRQMIVTLYEQDYYVYKNIGTQTKMQKKVFGIWWNCKCDEMVVGWSAIELKQKFDSNVFENIVYSLNYPPLSYPNTEFYDHPMPTWLTKNFPFANNYILFSIPYVNYDVTSGDINNVYLKSISFIEKSIKAWMKKQQKNSYPDNLGVISFVDPKEAYFLIGAEEISKKKVKTMQNKFLSQWFGGTYMVSISLDPNHPSFNVQDIIKSLSIKKNPTTLGRGSVYGAVKYKGEWRAGRITKDE